MTLHLGVQGFRLDLCVKHADLFEIEISAWTRVAVELPVSAAEPVSAPPAHVAPRTLRSVPRQVGVVDEPLPVPAVSQRQALAAIRERERLRAAQEALPPPQRTVQLTGRVNNTAIPAAFSDAQTASENGWRFTDHAIERAQMRNIPLVLAMQAVLRPTWTRTAKNGAAWYYGNGMRVCVNEREHTIITVCRPNEDDPHVFTHAYRREVAAS